MKLEFGLLLARHAASSRRSLAAALALTALGGCTAALDHVPTQADLARGNYARLPTASADSLVVASYNIMFGQQVELAIQELECNPLLAAADVLLLQEMHPGGCEQIARRLGYDFVYYPSCIHRRHDRPFGNAVLVRGRIVGQGFIILPKRGLLSGVRRIAVYADLEIAGRRLRAVSAHTSTIVLPHAQRVAQAQAIVDNLANVGGPMLIGGDFNTGSQDDVRAFREIMRHGGLRHVQLPGRATVRKPWRPFAGVSFMLDHFYYRGLRVRRCGIVDTARASDHFPIWSVFEWEADSAP